MNPTLYKIKRFLRYDNLLLPPYMLTNFKIFWITTTISYILTFCVSFDRLSNYITFNFLNFKLGNFVLLIFDQSYLRCLFAINNGKYAIKRCW